MLHDTEHGSFLYAVDNICAIYITSVIFLCMVGFEIPINAQSNITVVTLV